MACPDDHQPGSSTDGQTITVAQPTQRIVSVCPSPQPAAVQPAVHQPEPAPGANPAQTAHHPGIGELPAPWLVFQNVPASSTDTAVPARPTPPGESPAPPGRMDPWAICRTNGEVNRMSQEEQTRYYSDMCRAVKHASALEALQKAKKPPKSAQRAAPAKPPGPRAV